MKQRNVVWKPDHSVPYVIHCLNDNHHFLHGSVLIEPELILMKDESEEIMAFRFLMNRGHQFFGQHLKHTDHELWFLRDEDGDHDSFYIHPMTDDELDRYNAKFMSGKAPLSREGIVESYQEDLTLY